jgi:hypothetical protein
VQGKGRGIATWIAEWPEWPECFWYGCHYPTFSVKLQLAALIDGWNMTSCGCGVPVENRLGKSEQIKSNKPKDVIETVAYPTFASIFSFRALGRLEGCVPNTFHDVPCFHHCHHPNMFHHFCFKTIPSKCCKIMIQINHANDFIYK